MDRHANENKMKIKLTNENKTKGVYEDFSEIKEYLVLAKGKYVQVVRRVKQIKCW